MLALFGCDGSRPLDDQPVLVGLAVAGEIERRGLVGPAEIEVHPGDDQLVVGAEDVVLRQGAEGGRGGVAGAEGLVAELAQRRAFEPRREEGFGGGERVLRRRGRRQGVGGEGRDGCGARQARRRADVLFAAQRAKRLRVSARATQKAAAL